jgi:hypothetical protein
MSTLYVDNLQPNLGSRVMAAGHVVQVVSTTSKSHQSHATNTFAHFSGLDCTITPTSSSSKIFVSVNIFVGNASDDNYNQFIIYRQEAGGANVSLDVGDVIGNAARLSWGQNGPYTHAIYEVHNSSWQNLDSPNTNVATTYKLYARAQATGNRTMYLNRPSDTGDANRMSTVSSMTLMEIAQ